MGQNFSTEPVVEKETERQHNDVFNVAVSSCQGWRMSQEDNHSLILDLPGDHKASFFAVYDGHGSARVSKHASESLWQHIVDNDMYKKGDFRGALEKAFLTFDHEVNESYNAQLAGTTCVSILIVDNMIYCANIGDSRGVASINCQTVELSHDHKPDNPTELKRILAAGGYVLGNRVNGNLALSRAFGDFHYKGNDGLPPELQIVSPYPDIQMLDLNDNVDFLVLACDGIWDVLSSEEVVEFVIARLEQSMEPGLICEQLTTRCLATDYELVIGCDNMTVLLICYTRGRSWADYCTDIFNKNTRRLGINRTRPSSESGSNVDMIEATTATIKSSNDAPSEIERLNRNDYINILGNVVSSALTIGSNNEEEVNADESSSRQRNDEELFAMTEREKEADGRGTEETLVLRKVDQEPELEQVCTISEVPPENQTVDNNHSNSCESQQQNVDIKDCQPNSGMPDLGSEQSALVDADDQSKIADDTAITITTTEQEQCPPPEVEGSALSEGVGVCKVESASNDEDGTKPEEEKIGEEVVEDGSVEERQEDSTSQADDE